MPRPPNAVADCAKDILKHKGEAVTDDAHIVAAVEYSQKGERVPSLVLEAEQVPGAGALYLGGFRGILNWEFVSASVCSILSVAKGLEIFGPVYLRGLQRVKDAGVEVLQLDWVDSVDFVGVEASLRPPDR